MNEFSIAGRIIGVNHPPLVIAELGINHNGDLETAKQIVDSAKRAGAEIIKHQTHIIDDEMSVQAKLVIPGNSDKSIYSIMESCALDERDEIELQRYVEDLGMIFISSPFSRAAANRLEKMNVPAYKIGSGECNNYPLIEHIASFGKPMIISTGMNSLDDIAKTVEIVTSKNVPYALLHCTNVYPTPHHLVRLGAITELQDHFPNAIVGLSDHTTDNYACLGAVALGACILERHYTDALNRTGPDISCSMDEAALKELIHGSRILGLARGGKKGLLDEERITADFAFASVVTIKELKRGDYFTKENLWVKRPGTGEIHAEQYAEIIGKKCTRDLSVDTQLSVADIT